MDCVFSQPFLAMTTMPVPMMHAAMVNASLLQKTAATIMLAQLTCAQMGLAAILSSVVMTAIYVQQMPVRMDCVFSQQFLATTIIPVPMMHAATVSASILPRIAMTMMPAPMMLV